MRTQKYIYLILILLSSSLVTFTQEKVFVVTKTITREYDITNKNLIIQGEKADITLTNSLDDKVNIEIKLIAKSYIKEIAKRDLAVAKYRIEDLQNKLKIKNYFESEEISKVSSNLSVEYIIQIPENANIQIQNIYGDIYFDNTKVNGKVVNSFGAVTIENGSGKLDFDLSYAELKMINSRGNYTINSKSSKIVFDNISGNYTLKTLYGDLLVASMKNVDMLCLNGQRTKVDVSLPNIEDYSINMSTKRDNIIVPVELENKIIKDSGLSTFEQVNSIEKPTLNIHTTYCPITLNIK